MVNDFLIAGIGGALIGTSAVLLMVFQGKVAGISSIFFEVINPGAVKHAGTAWVFVLGLAIGASIFYFISGSAFPQPIAPLSMAIVSGFLVGFGSKLGSGCTSGHGVCGLSLFSFRSLIATLTFMSAGILTVSLLRHVF